MKIADPQTALVNLEAALEAWLELDPESVIPELIAYRIERECGTTACFAGWLPAFPHFAALGVVSASGGAPHIDKDFAAPETLFGKQGDELYCTRGWMELPGYSDHEVVTARLEEAIRRTKAELEELTQ